MNQLVWDSLESPFGPVYVALGEEGVCRVSLGGDTETFLSQFNSPARPRRDPTALAPVIAQLREYFSGGRVRFDLPLDLSSVTPFQRQALEIIREIPAGTVWTYRQVAQAMGAPKASRAVGQAMARNPIPIIVPCHRVIASDGSLGGYGAGEGLTTKRQLLEFEGALKP